MDKIMDKYKDANTNYIKTTTELTVMGEVYTPLPMKFYSYNDPEWSKPFNVRCAFCDRVAKIKPKFLVSMMDSDGGMYTKGSFDRFVCMVAYIKENRMLNENMIHGVLALYFRYHGKQAQYIPLITYERLNCSIFGGNLPVEEFYAHIDKLESEIL